MTVYFCYIKFPINFQMQNVMVTFCSEFKFLIINSTTFNVLNFVRLPLKELFCFSLQQISISEMKFKFHTTKYKVFHMYRITFIVKFFTMKIKTLKIHLFIKLYECMLFTSHFKLNFILFKDTC